MDRELKEIFGESINVQRGGKTVSIDAAHLTYYGKNEEYITWQILINQPGLCGNDEVLYTIYEVDVDVYSKGNYLDIENKVKEMMHDNSYVWVEDSEEMFEEDTKYYHKTITFEKERIN